MHEQERNAWKQIYGGVACLLLGGVLGYLVNPWFYALDLLGMGVIVMGWTDTTLYPGHPDYRKR